MEELFLEELFIVVKLTCNNRAMTAKLGNSITVFVLFCILFDSNNLFIIILLIRNALTTNHKRQ